MAQPRAPRKEFPFAALDRGTLNETESPAVTDLPPLDCTQTKRIEHGSSCAGMEWDGRDQGRLSYQPGPTAQVNVTHTVEG